MYARCVVSLDFTLKQFIRLALEKSLLNTSGTPFTYLFALFCVHPDFRVFPRSDFVLTFTQLPPWIGCSLSGMFAYLLIVFAYKILTKAHAHTFTTVHIGISTRMSIYVWACIHSFQPTPTQLLTMVFLLAIDLPDFSNVMWVVAVTVAAAKLL